MNYTQNEKLAQITPETLIIGVDIAKNKHVARAIDDRGFEFSKLAPRAGRLVYKVAPNGVQTGTNLTPGNKDGFCATRVYGFNGFCLFWFFGKIFNLLTKKEPTRLK